VLGLFKLVLAADRGTAIIYKTYTLGKCLFGSTIHGCKILTDTTALDHSAVWYMLAKAVAVCDSNQQPAMQYQVNTTQPVSSAYQESKPASMTEYHC